MLTMSCLTFSTTSKGSNGFLYDKVYKPLLDTSQNHKTLKTCSTTVTKNINSPSTIVVKKQVQLVRMARGLFWVIPIAFVFSRTKIFKPIFSMSLKKKNNVRCKISPHYVRVHEVQCE